MNDETEEELSELDFILSELDSLDFLELLELRSKLDTVIAVRAKQERVALNRRAKELQAFFGVGSTAELFIENKEKTPIEKPSPKKRSKAKPEKYYDFDTDSAWDGEGEKPQWLVDWIAAGKDPTELLIENNPFKGIYDGTR
jgi:DNA-binding protein H-NS